MHTHRYSHTHPYIHTYSHTHMHVHSHHVHLLCADLFFSFAVFKAGGKPLRSFRAVPHADIFFSQIMQQLLTSKEIVKENMMVFPLQVLCEVFDNPLTQVLLAAALLAGVHLELMEVSIMAIG